jgi:hypothetical protein
MIKIPQPLTLGGIAILFTKRALLSFGCALVAWSVMIVFVLLRYFNHPGGGWFPVWWGMASFSSVIYIWIYVILFLPLFLLVRPQNHLWSIYIVPFVFAFVGWIISKFGFNSGGSSVDPIINSFWLPVTIGSAVLGLTSAMVQRLVAKRMRRAEVIAANY